MYGIYLRTIERNLLDGMTRFEFMPTEIGWKNGPIQCVGKIGFYDYRMPLKIDGYFEKGVFVVEKEYLPAERKEDSFRLLEYLSKDLTEYQKERLIDLSDNDLLSFAASPGAGKIFSKIIRNQKTAKIVYSKLRALKEKDKLLNMLLPIGIPIDRIESLIRKSFSMKDIKKDPYFCLAEAGISVYAADALAKSLIDIKPYATIRVRGFIRDAIEQAENKGNTAIDLRNIKWIVNSRLKKSIYPEERYPMSLIYYAVSCMDKNETHIINKTPYVYKSLVWEEETSVIRNVNRLVRAPKPKVTDFDVSGGIYNKEQIEALNALKKSGIKILTGPPGSGKTTTIKLLIEQFKKAFPRGIVNLAATTGRAAQVMSESCGYPAQTLHKLLDIKPYESGLMSKNMNNPVNADLLIVDEVSMLGLKLASCLFSAIKSGSIVILVGDENQLQSVDYGNVFHDLLKNEDVEIYRLTKVMRQSGLICSNAERILKGDDRLDEDQFFKMYKYHSKEDAQSSILAAITKEDFQVLTPVKKGPLGTKELNKLIQKKIGRSGASLKYGDTNYYIGDRIIMLKTNYERPYYNGDIGIITGIDEESLIVRFDDHVICLDNDDFINMSLAYAITIHKSQGSEFNDVIIALPDEPKNMLTRRLFYTAVTRAKKTVRIYCSGDADKTAVMNQFEPKRTSLLNDRFENIKKST